MKKELGALKETVTSEVTNKAARELSTKEKIKFKDAVKRVNAQKQEQLDLWNLFEKMCYNKHYYQMD